jgi:methylated-DNA-[protein]-cysteine S-methyltransferase
VRKVRTSRGLHCLVQPSPVGLLGMVAGDEGLVEVLLQPTAALLAQQLHARHPLAREGAGKLLQQAGAQFEAYFRRERRAFELPLDYSGLSAFTVCVLRTLQGIPFGATVGYGQLAEMVGSPGGARAVGGVMAANPFPLLIPCHRVLGSGGKLGGYSGGEGIATKEWLLAFEGVRLPGRFTG